MFKLIYFLKTNAQYHICKVSGGVFDQKKKRNLHLNSTGADAQDS
jgi:hypothetical protein